MLLPSQNSIDRIIVSMLAPSALDRGFEPGLGQNSEYMNFVFAVSPLRSKRKDLVGSESGQCVRVKHHVYPMTVVSVS